MNNDEIFQKSLAKITNDERGWRKSLATAEGSFSKNLAEENLRRLAVERQTLLNQVNTTNLHRKHIMEVAIRDGMITDHISDGVCEQLLKEGWLEQAGPTLLRPHVNRAQAYLPTENAVQNWQIDVKPSVAPAGVDGLASGE